MKSSLFEIYKEPSLLVNTSMHFTWVDFWQQNCWVVGHWHASSRWDHKPSLEWLCNTSFDRRLRLYLPMPSPGLDVFPLNFSHPRGCCIF